MTKNSRNKSRSVLLWAAFSLGCIMFGIKRRDSNAPPGPTGTLNLSAEDYGLLLGIYEQQLGTRDDIMALSKQVQDLLDRSKQESDMIKSMATSMKALLQQSADMQAKLDRVPVAPEPAMSQEDKDALTEIASDMDTAILTAQQVIPQNLSPAAGNGASASSSGSGSASIGSASSIAGGAGGSSDAGSAGLTDKAQSGGSDSGQSGSQSSAGPVDGTATPVDMNGNPPTGAPQPQADAAQADSQHAQDAQAASQATPLAGTGGS
jgi:hypothetical protein